MTELQKHLEHMMLMFWGHYVHGERIEYGDLWWEQVQMYIDRWLEIVEPKKWWQQILESKFKIEALLKMQGLRKEYLFRDSPISPAMRGRKSKYKTATEISLGSARTTKSGKRDRRFK